MELLGRRLQNSHFVITAALLPLIIILFHLPSQAFNKDVPFSTTDPSVTNLNGTLPGARVSMPTGDCSCPSLNELVRSADSLASAVASRSKEVQGKIDSLSEAGASSGNALELACGAQGPIDEIQADSDSLSNQAHALKRQVQPAGEECLKRLKIMTEERRCTAVDLDKVAMAIPSQREAVIQALNSAQVLQEDLVVKLSTYKSKVERFAAEHGGCSGDALARGPQPKQEAGKVISDVLPDDVQIPGQEYAALPGQVPSAPVAEPPVSSPSTPMAPRSEVVPPSNSGNVDMEGSGGGFSGSTGDGHIVGSEGKDNLDPNPSTPPAQPPIAQEQGKPSSGPIASGGGGGSYSSVDPTSPKGGGPSVSAPEARPSLLSKAKDYSRNMLVKFADAVGMGPTTEESASLSSGRPPAELLSPQAIAAGVNSPKALDPSRPNESRLPNGSVDPRLARGGVDPRQLQRPQAVAPNAVPGQHNRNLYGNPVVGNPNNKIVAAVSPTAALGMPAAAQPGPSGSSGSLIGSVGQRESPCADLRSEACRQWRCQRGEIQCKDSNKGLYQNVKLFEGGEPGGGSKQAAGPSLEDRISALEKSRLQVKPQPARPKQMAAQKSQTVPRGTQVAQPTALKEQKVNRMAASVSAGEAELIEPAIEEPSWFKYLPKFLTDSSLMKAFFRNKSGRYVAGQRTEIGPVHGNLFSSVNRAYAQVGHQMVRSSLASASQRPALK